MVSVLYVCVFTPLLVKLSFDVIKLRRRFQVSIGDGGQKELHRAIRAHANALEYAPLAFILLLMLEFNGAPMIIVHILGLAFVMGRFSHQIGVKNPKKFKFRLVGMYLTFFPLLTLAIVNLIYLPYSKLL